MASTLPTRSPRLRLTELDFDAIKASLIEFLQAQTEFTDYDFEGSGMSVLLDLLAYNTHYSAYYINMLANESYLDTALSRDSIVSLAKHLNYVPTSKRGAKAVVNVTIVPVITDLDSSYTLDRYREFRSKAINGINYTFTNFETYVASRVNDQFTFENVEIFQGEPTTYRFDADPTNNPYYRFQIPNASVDTDSLLVSVQVSDVDTTSYVYTRANNITTPDGNSNVYFLEASGKDFYTVCFGDNVIGRRPSSTAVVTVSYTVTAGSDANKANSFTYTDTLPAGWRAYVSPVSESSGGDEAETNDQIRFRAPLAYVAQNRCVTINDFEVLLPSKFSSVESVAAWGGEDNDPPVYGKVFISLKPKENYVIPDYEKEEIKQTIMTELGVVTIIPEIIDPDYTYIIIKAPAEYDASKTTLTANQISTNIRSAILTYVRENLNDFGSTFRQSRLDAAVDAADPSILGSHSHIWVQKRIKPILNQARNYTIKFNLPLHRGGGQDDKLTTYPQFVITDSQGIDRNAFIEESTVDSTGIESIEITNTGQGYEYPPAIVITGDGYNANAYPVIVNGKLESVVIDSAGTNYTIAYATVVGPCDLTATTSVTVSQKYGKLNIYYRNSLGEKVLLAEETGTINYTTGEIQLYNFAPKEIKSNDRYDDGVLVFTIEPVHKTLSTVRNGILKLDENDSKSITLNTMPYGTM